MTSQTVIRDQVRVEKHVTEYAVEGTSFEHAWRCKLVLESGHDFPVAVRVVDDLPPGHAAPNVGVPPGENQEGWTLEERRVAGSCFLEPGDPVEVSYTLFTDRSPEDAAISPPAIEKVQPVDPGVPAEENGAPVWRGNGTDAATAGTGGAGGQLLREPDPHTRRTGSHNGHDEGTVELGFDVEGATGGTADLMAVSERAAAASDVLVPRTSEASPTVTVVLPTMNEEEGVGECIDRVKRAFREIGYTAEILVSDSSEDRTPHIAAERGAHVVTPEQKGYGAAYRYAFDRARGEYLVMGDADTTYDFEELPELFRKLQAADADIVMGSRLAGEIKPGAMPALHQYVGNPLLTRFLNVFYDAGVTDAHSGMRVIRRDALEALDLRSNGMEFASEMIMQGAERGLAIEEVPITYHERTGEATLDSFRDGWRHVRFMLVNAPDYLFTTPAFVFAVLGLCTMGISLSGVSIGGVQFGTYTMIAGSLFTILAFNIGSLALFSSIAGNPIREPQDPITRIVNERFQLEHAATVGLVLFTVGSVYATLQVLQWVNSGFTELPLVPANLLAFTVIMLGLQTVFYAFFFSMLGAETNEQGAG